MGRFSSKSSKKVGLPPGSLIASKEDTRKVNLRLMSYDADSLDEKEVSDVSEIDDLKKTIWVDVDGVHNIEVIEKLGEKYGLHPLVMEDILNTDQRPKLEEYDNYLYIVLKVLHYNRETSEMIVEQLSFVLGDDFVISFQELPDDVFDAVRNRLRAGKGRIRKMGADYLLYALVDSIVDSYFVVLENIGIAVESLETELMEDATQEHQQVIHVLKREMLAMRKGIWPLREVINTLQREGTPFIGKAVRPFLRDVYDHTIQVIDTMETFRDMVSGMMDLYLSSISNRMNEVMKVLTIIATIFIPLTFIAGVYGMNFEYMPELAWRWGYFATLGLMFIIGIIMVVYFKRKDWL